jgi:hypothetical protein
MKTTNFKRAITALALMLAVSISSKAQLGGALKKAAEKAKSEAKSEVKKEATKETKKTDEKVEEKTVENTTETTKETTKPETAAPKAEVAEPQQEKKVETFDAEHPEEQWYIAYGRYEKKSVAGNEQIPATAAQQKAIDQAVKRAQGPKKWLEDKEVVWVYPIEMSGQLENGWRINRRNDLLSSIEGRKMDCQVIVKVKNDRYNEYRIFNANVYEVYTTEGKWSGDPYISREGSSDGYPVYYTESMKK